MAEEEGKIGKFRLRMERDIYSVLLSFKDGATPMQLEKRMDETLGYTYNGKYYQGGVHDMAQLLREHSKVRQGVDGKFKIIPTEEVADLVALISKQKDGKGKKKGRGGASGKQLRPMTSTGYRPSHGTSGFVLRSSPRGGGFRPSTGLALRQNPARPNGISYGLGYGHIGFGGGHHHHHHQLRPFSSASYTRQSSSSSSGFGSVMPPKPQITLNQSFGSTTTVQRPLRPPVTTTSSGFAASPFPPLHPVQQSATVKEATKSSDEMPSISKFTENSKKMLVMMYPRRIHLSELTELYYQEYGVIVDPLQLFSKSWNMLVQTSFKDWLQIIDGEVILRTEWYKTHGWKYKIATPVKAPPKSAPVPTESRAPSSAVLFDFSALDQQTSSSHQQLFTRTKSTTSVPAAAAAAAAVVDRFPPIQGFQYQAPEDPKSPTEAVTAKMRGLTVSARRFATLPTPEKPPGMSVRETTQRPVTPLQDLFRERSKTVTAPTPTVAARKSLADHEYDSNNMRNLKYVEKTPDIKNRVSMALSGKISRDELNTASVTEPQAYPDLQQSKKKSFRRATNAYYVTKETTPTVSTPVPPASLLQHSPTDSSLYSTPTPPSTSSISPPDVPPVRMRPLSANCTTPTHRLIGRALEAVKKQEHESPIPRRSGRKASVGNQSQQAVLADHDQTAALVDSDEDGWGEILPVKSAEESEVTVRKPMKLPPMSKGSGTGLRSRPLSTYTSAASSRSSSRARRLIDEAQHCSLPDSDDW